MTKVNHIKNCIAAQYR